VGTIVLAQCSIDALAHASSSKFRFLQQSKITGLDEKLLRSKSCIFSYKKNKIQQNPAVAFAQHLLDFLLHLAIIEGIFPLKTSHQFYDKDMLFFLLSYRIG
jgi:hypothetical protein